MAKLCVRFSLALTKLYVSWSDLILKEGSADKVWDERYIQRRMKNNPPSKYSVGKTVVIRFPFSKKSRTAPKRRFVLAGKMIKRNLRIAKYKISFENPKTKSHQCAWVSVEDSTSLIVEKEKRRKDLAKERLKNKGKSLNKKEQQSSHRKKYYIPLERNDQHEAFRDQGFAISFNPAGDGSCQFAAVVHALQDVGIYRSNETLRREIVQCLSDNPNAADGSPLELFAAMPWAEYLNTTATNSTYGDQLSLQAMANLYLVEIIVISSLGPQNCLLTFSWVIFQRMKLATILAWSLIIEFIKRVTKKQEKKTKTFFKMVKKMNMNKTIMKMVSKMMQYFLTTNKTLKTLKITVNSNSNNNSKRKKNKNNDNKNNMKKNKKEKLLKKLNWNHCQRRSSI